VLSVSDGGFLDPIKPAYDRRRPDGRRGSISRDIGPLHY